MRGLLLLLICMPLQATAECIDWRRSNIFVDIEKASVVFEGVVERIDAGGTETCAPDRVVLAVDRVWKGASEREYVLFQDNLHGTVTERLTKDSTVVRSCLTNPDSTIFTKGVRYIVYASGPVDDLRSMGCSTSRATNDKVTKDERRRLDRWKRSSGSDRK